MLRRLLASPRLYLAAALLTAGAALWSALSSHPDPRPRGDVQALDAMRERDDLNVVFLLIDTLRADRLGIYGHTRPTSPNLDALARTGIRFANVVSQSSWTKCSMASLWTGTVPVANGVLRYPHALPEAARMPAEILHEAGFRTAGIWRNGWVDPSFGFGQGFDTYVKPRPYDPKAAQDLAQRRARSPYALIGNDWNLTESALAFLRAFGHERFFLYLHYMDVHQYVSDKSTPKFGTTYSDIYDNAIAWVDRNVAALVDALAAQDLLDHTVIVIASDHGEEFGEHGGEGHARTLFHEVTTTPWIVALPFRLDPGLVVPERVRNLDLWPTLLDLLGLPPLPMSDGRSLRPEIRARLAGEAPVAPDETEVAVAYLDRRWGRVGAEPRPFVALHQGRYRLLHFSEDPAKDQLFDVRADPTEQKDLAEDLPAVTDRLRGLAAQELARPPAPWGKAVEIQLGGMQLQLLRALGYAVGASRQRGEGAAGGEPAPQDE